MKTGTWRGRKLEIIDEHPREPGWVIVRFRDGSALDREDAKCSLPLSQIEELNEA
jgi:hypothetical protein